MFSAVMASRAQDTAGAGDERLLELYWNRAAVKQQLAALRRERDGLVSRLREEEAERARQDERLRQLEALLSDEERAACIIVHCQLRALWQEASARVAALAADLAERQAGRERARLHEAFESRRRHELAVMSTPLAALRSEVSDLAERGRALERLLSDLGFWRWGRRRQLRHELSCLDAERAQRAAELEALAAREYEVRAAPIPEYPGLSVESRRLVNLALIAFAQDLVVVCEQGDVARLARAAMTGSLEDADYGSRNEVEALGRAVARSRNRLAALEPSAARLKPRVAWLRTQVEYRREDEAEPLAHSLERFPRELGREASPLLRCNVLAEDYWGLHTALR